MPLKGKTVFLTGATGGIGIPLGLFLEKAGATLRRYDRASSGDLMENIDTVCKELRENTPDILVNLAGMNDFAHAEAQDYDVLTTINLLVPMRLAQAVLPAMRKRRAGQIINIGSMTGLIPLPHMTGYVAAKAGLKGFSDALRRELAGTGVTVSHIAPRAVRTAMNSGKAGILNQRCGVHEDSAESVAMRIYNAIAHHEADVRIGWPERFFAMMNALFPSMVDKGLRKNAAIGNDILGQVPAIARGNLLSLQPGSGQKRTPA